MKMGPEPLWAALSASLLGNPVNTVEVDPRPPIFNQSALSNPAHRQKPDSCLQEAHP
jgi:hypothetical protein